MSSERIIGIVKWFNRAKAWGFIERPGDRDVFVHIRDLPHGIQEMMPGQKVSYVLEDNHKGPRAKQVELLR
jgi:CspA family cold shock protein